MTAFHNSNAKLALSLSVLSLCVLGFLASPVTAQNANPPAQTKPLAQTLSADERTEFVKNVMEGCLEGQREAPENKGVPQSAIDAYCQCTAVQMIERFNMEEIEKIAEAMTAELQARVNQIEKVCIPKAK